MDASEFMSKQDHWIKLHDDTYAEPQKDGVWLRRFTCGNDYQCNVIDEVFLPWPVLGKLNLVRMQHENRPAADEPA